MVLLTMWYEKNYLTIFSKNIYHYLYAGICIKAFHLWPWWAGVTDLEIIGRNFPGMSQFQIYLSHMFQKHLCIRISKWFFTHFYLHYKVACVTLRFPFLVRKSWLSETIFAWGQPLVASSLFFSSSLRLHFGLSEFPKASRIFWAKGSATQTGKVVRLKRHKSRAKLCFLIFFVCVSHPILVFSR